MGSIREKRVRPGKVVHYLSYPAFFISLSYVYHSISKEVVLLSIFLVLFSILLDMKNFHPPRPILNVASVIIIILQGLKVDLDRIVEIGTELIVILTAIKFIEEKRSRDYLQIYVLQILLLSAGAFFSFGFDFILGSFVVFFILSTSVILLTFSQDTPGSSFELREIMMILKSSASLFILSIFLSCIIFFILPRTDYPVLSFLNKVGKARTGISDTIRLGEFSQIEEDDSIVLRVKMERIPERFLYWRRCVLDQFDGTEWKRSRERLGQKRDWDLGAKVHQVIISYEDLSPYVVGLERPLRVEGIRVGKSRDYIFFLLEPPKARMRYEVVSAIGSKEMEDSIDPIYLQVPSSMKRKLRDFADGIVSGSSSMEEVVERIYSFLSEGEYEYSLDKLPQGKEAIEDFLFRSKRGNCEFFASSMALLLRAEGIPSRIVTGFRGGEYNEVGNYYVVRRKDAHAWVEAYIYGKGWTRYDPTPPREIGQTKGGNKFTRIEKILDSINYHLTNLIIAYDLERQIDVFTKIGLSFREIPTVKGKWIFLVTLILVPVSFAIGFVSFRLIFLPYEKEVLRGFLNRLRKRGIKRLPNEGLCELVERIEDEGLRRKAFEFVGTFQECFFKDMKIPTEKRKALERILKEMDNVRL